MFAVVDLAVLGLAWALARAGWRRGFAAQALDLAGFFLALVASLRFYRITAAPFRWVGVSENTAYVLGGAAIFIPLILVVAVAGLKVNRFTWQPGVHLTNRVLGVGFGVALSAAVMTFLLAVTQFAPVPRWMNDAARRSPTGRLLLSSAFPAAGFLQDVAAKDAEKMILYLRQSLRPLSRDGRAEVDEPPPMRFPAAPASEVTVSAGSERELFELLNRERRRKGLRSLEWDARLRDVGRAHAFDMYVQGYFAHTGLDGSAPSDRLRSGGVEFIVSGENLAIAPTVSLAHSGLMRSPGHRRNILDAEFSKGGIGIYSGPRGLVATQQFCGGC